MDSSTYPESTIDEQGGSDADVKSRIGKGRMALLQSSNIWNSEQRSINIKVRFFGTNVETVLQYEQKRGELPQSSSKL
ncbi:unnamed protein product [Schistosoma curassoni]|uniref:DUF6451 domain-containing protein n=1 Tax=Schistosoma curassoni TaxID=6186 RepID=A0A183KM34_9TREM|nr:unnamed protein product [Schistosoma curassoni]